SLDNEKFKALRKDARQRGISFRLPKQVYEELGGDHNSRVEEYEGSDLPVDKAIEEGWVEILVMFEKYGYGDQVEFVYAFDYIDDLVS
ncbi:MAG: hypothetical protein ABEJ83_03400, partial [Candidatus Nanohaloarchaea archaeon]